MTHLGLGSSFEEPWLGLLGGGGSVAFPGGCTGLLGRLCGLLPRGVPIALPACPGEVIRLPAWDDLGGGGS